MLFVMGCIRNQPGKGLPDARGLFAVRAGQPAGEERKSCHCQGPGRGEDKAVPAGENAVGAAARFDEREVVAGPPFVIPIWAGPGLEAAEYPRRA